MQQTKKSKGDDWQAPPVAFRLTTAERAALTEFRRTLPDLPHEADLVRRMLRAATPYRAGETLDVETKMGEAVEKFVVRITGEDRERIALLRRAEPDIPGASELMRRIGR
jgi:hypothetical protein